MKKFLYSFLGTMAGIWVSVILLGVLFFMTIGALVMSSKDGSPFSMKDDSVLHIVLSGEVTDRETPISLRSQLLNDTDPMLSLSQLVDAINAAKEDKNIDGIFLDCRGASMGAAQAQTLVTALNGFKESGKWIYSYADTYSQAEYFVASSADSVFVNPVGMIDIHGLQATTMYYKELLDKIGVNMQVVKVGTYKSAVEPFLLNDMSDANREQQTVFLGSIWEVMKKSIADRRKVSPDSVNSWANNFAFAKQSDFYLKNKIVDGVKYRHEVEEMLADETGVADEPRLVSVSDYMTVAKSPLRKLSGKGKNIAVLYALGDITESGTEGITSEQMVPVILKLAKDKNVDGLILRVNSGGGSAYASEQIWEALEQYKKISGNPFYVSMSDMAASGGYYISCGADKIYAEPMTLTGSIGIFGMIPDFKPLMKDKLGVSTFTISTNTGSMPSVFQPMTEQQRAAMQGYVNQGYELFVKRCANGRKKSVDQIKAIAEGRVWDGTTALKIGLVDKLGGLQMAIDDMAKALGTDNYRITDYPDVNTKWWEMLLEMDSEMQGIADDSGLRAAYMMSKAYRQLRDMSPLQCRTNYIRLH